MIAETPEPIVLWQDFHEALNVFADRFVAVPVQAVIDPLGNGVIVAGLKFGAAEARELAESILRAASLVDVDRQAVLV